MTLSFVYVFILSTGRCSSPTCTSPTCSSPTANTSLKKWYFSTKFILCPLFYRKGIYWFTIQYCISPCCFRLTSHILLRVIYLNTWKIVALFGQYLYINGQRPVKVWSALETFFKPAFWSALCNLAVTITKVQSSKAIKLIRT